MYKKLLLKISGDLLSSESSSFDPKKIENLAKTLVSFQQKYDVCLAIVVGAGNIWRFRDNKHL
ncbi:UMP kinase, partial [bacterium]|nr:UMP kinase [bacterium]